MNFVQHVDEIMNVNIVDLKNIQNINLKKAVEPEDTKQH